MRNSGLAVGVRTSASNHLARGNRLRLFTAVAFVVVILAGAAAAAVSGRWPAPVLLKAESGASSDSITPISPTQTAFGDDGILRVVFNSTALAASPNGDKVYSNLGLLGPGILFTEVLPKSACAGYVVTVALPAGRTCCCATG